MLTGLDGGNGSSCRVQSIGMPDDDGAIDVQAPVCDLCRPAVEGVVPSIRVVLEYPRAVDLDGFNPGDR